MTQVDRLLNIDPLKEASLFYLKTDFALLAAAAITFTLFQVNPGEILGLVAFISPFMYTLIALMVLGVVSHGLIIRVQVSECSLPKTSGLARVMVFLVMLQVAANVSLFIFSAGFVAKEIDIQVERNSNKAVHATSA